MTYEGARSITGPFLAFLGANALVVGFLSGFGELIGYVLRFFSGYLTERTRQYWAITIIGYVINLRSPFIGLSGRLRSCGSTFNHRKNRKSYSSTSS